MTFAFASPWWLLLFVPLALLSWQRRRRPVSVSYLHW